MKNRKYIISGGGTGGHIFPALSIANEIRKEDPGAEILFVGALGRMEMEKVPAAGYSIVGLPVEGLRRKLGLYNFVVAFKAMVSLCKASGILRSYKPDAVIGVGGYASGPMLRMAARKNIPTLIQEQNSYAGVTNRLLSRKAKSICVAYEGMEKYFPAEKIVLTGNPVREELFRKNINVSEAYDFFGIPPGKPVLLILGGSLGARTINQSILKGVKVLENENITVLWQTGRLYFEEIRATLEAEDLNNIRYFDFIHRMDLAYHIADVIISRAGAATISELCILGKPCVLVPSPNVAEDHQTKNALALVSRKAALMVKDSEATALLVKEALELLKNETLKAELGKNCLKLALPGAASNIVHEIFKIAGNRERNR